MMKGYLGSRCPQRLQSEQRRHPGRHGSDAQSPAKGIPVQEWLPLYPHSCPNISNQLPLWNIVPSCKKAASKPKISAAKLRPQMWNEWLSSYIYVGRNFGKRVSFEDIKQSIFVALEHLEAEWFGWVPVHHQVHLRNGENTSPQSGLDACLSADASKK